MLTASSDRPRFRIRTYQEVVHGESKPTGILTKSQLDDLANLAVCKSDRWNRHEADLSDNEVCVARVTQGLAATPKQLDTALRDALAKERDRLGAAFGDPMKPIQPAGQLTKSLLKSLADRDAVRCTGC